MTSKYKTLQYSICFLSWEVSFSEFAAASDSKAKAESSQQWADSSAWLCTQTAATPSLHVGS